LLDNRERKSLKKEFKNCFCCQLSLRRSTNIIFLLFHFFSFSFPSFPTVNRLSQVQSENAGKVSKLLACRETIEILDKTYGEDAMVLLVCHRAGIF
jgi:hypothetical protein